MPNAYNGTAFPVAGTQMGLALESTRGVAPASVAAWIPVKAPKYKPMLTLLPDETLQGSMVQTYDLVTGIRYDSHGWNAPPYLDTFSYLLAAEFGSQDNLITAATGTLTTTASVAAGYGLSGSPIAISGGGSVAGSVAANHYLVFGAASAGTLETHQVSSVSANGASVLLGSPLQYSQLSGAAITCLNTHRFSVVNNNVAGGNQPPSFTLTDFSGEEWRQITGAQLDQLSIKGNGTSLVDYTCTWFGNPATEPSTSASVTTYSASAAASPVLNFGAASVVTNLGLTSNSIVQGPGIYGTASVNTISGASVILAANGTGSSVNGNYIQTGVNYLFTNVTFSPSYGTTQTTAPWSFYAKLGVGAASVASVAAFTPTIIDWSLDFKRNVKPIPALTGQQNYFSYFAGPLVSTGKLTFVEQSGSPELNNFLNAQTQQLDLTLFDQKLGNALNFHASRMQFSTGEIDRSKEWVQVVVDFTLLPSTNDALAGGVAPCVVSVANSTGTSYYGY